MFTGMKMPSGMPPGMLAGSPLDLNLAMLPGMGGGPYGGGKGGAGPMGKGMGKGSALDPDTEAMVSELEEEVFAVLASDDPCAFEVVVGQVKELPGPEALAALSCKCAPGRQPWGSLLGRALGRVSPPNAASQGPEQEQASLQRERNDVQRHLLDLLCALTDFRVPPPRFREFEAQFGDGALCEQLVAALSRETPRRSRLLACTCARNLARAPGLRALLAEHRAVPALVAALSEHSPEPVAAAAAEALCNVGCTPTTKVTAMEEGAVPKLLKALSVERRPKAADDTVACLGVLTAGTPQGSEAVMACQLGAEPLVAALKIDDATLRGTVVDVLGGLVAGSQALGHQLAANPALVREHLPGLVCSSTQQTRVNALKLCLLLLEAETAPPGVVPSVPQQQTAPQTFRAAFKAAGGVEAVIRAVDLEPPPPPLPVTELPKRKRAGKPTKAQLCTIACENSCCFPNGLDGLGGPPLGAAQPPSRREIAEMLLEQLQEDP